MDIGESSGWGGVGRDDSKEVELKFEIFVKVVCVGVDRDIGVELFSGDYGVVELEVGGKFDDISISKDIKYKADINFDDSIGQDVDKDVDA